MTGRITHLSIFLLLLVAALVCLSACSEDNDILIPPELPVPGSGSAAQLMVDFLGAYEDRDVAELSNVMHPEYEMVLQARTRDEFPNVGETLEVAAELRIAKRMFSGEPFTNPDGNLVPGVSNISFQVFEQESGWVLVEPGSEFAGSQSAMFFTIILLDRPGFSTLRVEGLLLIYVSEFESVSEGTPRTYWQMVGMHDMTGGGVKGGETATWGSVKSLFWSSE